MYLARIYITLKSTVNDPQGQTVLGGLKTLGLGSVDSVRVGKYLEVKLLEAEQERAEEQVNEMCPEALGEPGDRGVSVRAGGDILALDGPLRARYLPCCAGIDLHGITQRLRQCLEQGLRL